MSQTAKSFLACTRRSEVNEAMSEDDMFKWRKIDLIFFSVLVADNFSPSAVVSDDGLHLAEFVKNHFGGNLAVTATRKLLMSIPFSIGRVHYKNHIGKWCRENMNPDENRCELLVHMSNTLKTSVSVVVDEINTEVQRF